MAEEMNVTQPVQPEAAKQNKEEGQETEPRMFTQEEVNKIVEKRLSRERQKLAGVIGSDDPREIALAERERAVSEKELRLDTAETFRREGLPMEALDLINYTDKEQCEQSIELVRKVFSMNVQEAVEKRLRGGKPLKKAPDENSLPDFRGAFGLR